MELRNVDGVKTQSSPGLNRESRQARRAEWLTQAKKPGMGIGFKCNYLFCWTCTLLKIKRMIWKWEHSVSCMSNSSCSPSQSHHSWICRREVTSNGQAYVWLLPCFCQLRLVVWCQRHPLSSKIHNRLLATARANTWTVVCTCLLCRSADPPITWLVCVPCVFDTRPSVSGWKTLWWACPRSCRPGLSPPQKNKSQSSTNRSCGKSMSYWFVYCHVYQGTDSSLIMLLALPRQQRPAA